MLPVFSKLINHLQDPQYKKWLESDTPELQVPTLFFETMKPLSEHEKALYEYFNFFSATLNVLLYQLWLL